MELTKNIFFNTDKLIPFAKIKISYTGNLFNETSEEVYIRYGFGNDWNNTTNMEQCQIVGKYFPKTRVTCGDNNHTLHAED